MAKVRMLIDKQGNPKILDGGGGKDCMARTADIEAKLGLANEHSRHLTESFFEEQEEHPQLLHIEHEDGEA
jgi:hypothetical protein